MTNIQIITWIIASGLFSGVLTTIISHFSLSVLNKNERKSNLNKEEYMILQEKAVQMFGYLHCNENILKSMYTQLKNGVGDWTELTKDNNIKESKQRTFEILHVYFFELGDEYNKYAEKLSQYFNIYFRCIKNKKITESDAVELNQLMSEVGKKEYSLIKAIVNYIDNKRDGIIK